MKIYLAGGFKSRWQDYVKTRAPKHQYFDPQKDADQKFAYRWAEQDLDGLITCHLVFAYFEVDNPSGLGLAQEVGAATILNIPTWYIDEHDRLNSFLCACSQRVYSSFHKAVEDLNATDF